MSAIASLFSQSSDKRSSGDDRLTDLYWNRNELKKAFAELRKEKFKLADRLKSKEADLARMQQKFEQIEQLLADPDWSRSVMVMYRLRGLGTLCARKLANFAEHIKQQREKKKHSEAVSKWRAKVDRDVAAVKERMSELEQKAFGIEEAIKQEEQGFEAMGSIGRFLRRRSVRRAIESLAVEAQEIEARLQEHRDKIDAIRSGQPPEVQGLILGEKRSINAMILAFAQQLYIDIDDDELVSLVKEASDKGAGAMRFADDHECEDVLQRVARSGKRLEANRDVAARLGKRARMISEAAAYNDDQSAVPVPDTVTALIRFGENDVVQTGIADLLGQNYWGLVGVLSR